MEIREYIARDKGFFHEIRLPYTPGQPTKLHFLTHQLSDSFKEYTETRFESGGVRVEQREIGNGIEFTFEGEGIVILKPRTKIREFEWSPGTSSTTYIIYVQDMRATPHWYCKERQKWVPSEKATS